MFCLNVSRVDDNKWLDRDSGPVFFEAADTDHPIIARASEPRPVCNYPSWLGRPRLQQFIDGFLGQLIAFR